MFPVPRCTRATSCPETTDILRFAGFTLSAVGGRTRDAGRLTSFSVFSVFSVAGFFASELARRRWASCVSPTYNGSVFA